MPAIKTRWRIEGAFMEILNPDWCFERIRKELGQSVYQVLLMDYDGTLAPFHPEPAKAIPYPGVPELIERAARMDSIRLVLITGRRIQDLIPLLNVEKKPEIWGSHGMERLQTDGTYSCLPVEEPVERGLEVAEAWLVAEMPTLYRERKPGSLAVHWRGQGSDRISEIRRAVDRSWAAIAEGCDLGVQPFDGGMELRTKKTNKGVAVEEILAESRAGSFTAYFGDDLTDEDAFGAIKGRGLGVLVREAFRATAADIWIQPPEELFELLHLWLTEEHRRQDRC